MLYRLYVSAKPTFPVFDGLNERVILNLKYLRAKRMVSVTTEKCIYTSGNDTF